MGFVAEKLIFPDKDSKHDFWQTTNTLCAVGLGTLLMSALSFYRQRSLLAWYYGQLSLYRAQGNGMQEKKLLTDSDAWYNWRWYQAGFGCLTCAFLELITVGLSSVHARIATYETFIAISILILCALGTAFFIIAYARYPYKDEPLNELWKSIFNRTTGT